MEVFDVALVAGDGRRRYGTKSKPDLEELNVFSSAECSWFGSFLPRSKRNAGLWPFQLTTGRQVRQAVRANRHEGRYENVIFCRVAAAAIQSWREGRSIGR